MRDTLESPAARGRPVELPGPEVPPPGPPAPGDSSCVLFTGCSGEPETLWMESDGGRWHVGHWAFHQKMLGGVGITEWVPVGETVHDHTEMVTFQWFGEYPSPRDAESRLRERMEARCPGVEWRLLREEKRDVIFTWRIEGCASAEDQREIARIVEGERGTHFVHYLSMGTELPPEVRQAWIRRLGEATVVAGPRRLPVLDPIGPQWQPWRSTPGVRLRLVERERKKDRGHVRVIYGVETAGFPSGKTYRLWNHPLGDTTIVFSGDFEADEGGSLVCAEVQSDPNSFLCDETGVGRTLDEMLTMNAYQYQDGEPFRTAAVSRDGNVRAYAKAVPFPLVAEEGSCRLELELIPTYGPLFHAWGTGFPPGEAVRIEIRSGDTRREVQVTPGDDGRLAALVNPIEPGEEGGKATVRAAAGVCSPRLELRWGDEVEVH